MASKSGSKTKKRKPDAYGPINRRLFELLDLGRDAELRLREAFAAGDDLPDDEARELVEAWQAGREARRALYYLNQRLVYSEMRKMPSYSTPFSTREAAAREGLLNAIDGYDRSSGNRFSPYAGRAIRNSVRGAVRDDLASDYFGMEEAVTRLREARNKLFDDYAATMTDIACTSQGEQDGDARLCATLAAVDAVKKLNSFESLVEAYAEIGGVEVTEGLCREVARAVLVSQRSESAESAASDDGDADDMRTKGDMLRDDWGKDVELQAQFLFENEREVKSLSQLMDDWKNVAEDSHQVLCDLFGFGEEGSALTPKEIAKNYGASVQEIEDLRDEGMAYLREAMAEAGVSKEDIGWTRDA